MRMALLLGILVTLVLGGLSISYKTQNVPADDTFLTPSSQTGWPFTYKHIGARGLCEGSNQDDSPTCDPPLIYNFYALGGDIILCLMAGAATSSLIYFSSRPLRR